MTVFQIGDMVRCTDDGRTGESHGSPYFGCEGIVEKLHDFVAAFQGPGITVHYYGAGTIIVRSSSIERVSAATAEKLKTEEAVRAEAKRRQPRVVIG